MTVDTCRQFVSLDSSPGQGTGAVVAYAAELCRANGWDTLVYDEVTAIASENPDAREVNLVVRPLGAVAGPELMLQTHLDTPDPGPFGLWSRTGHNPFEAHIIEGRIYGLGTADVKLDFLCKMEALKRLGSQKWRHTPVLVGTFGEELGMIGALRLIRKNRVKAKWALIGEPSGGHLIVAGKGIATVEIRVPFESDEMKFRAEHDLTESSATQSRIFNGKAVHSSTPQLGDSAILKMLSYLSQLPENLTIMDIGGGVNFNTVPARAFLEIEPISGHRLPMAQKLNQIYQGICELDEAFRQFEDPRFTPSSPTLNVGLIRCFEDHVLLSGNCRITPNVGAAQYEAWMKSLSQRCSAVGAVLRVSDYKRPFLTDETSSFVTGALAELRLQRPQARLVTQSSTNEASLFSRVGVECLCFGPGERENNIHTPDESVSLDDLESAVHFYEGMIRRICL